MNGTIKVIEQLDKCKNRVKVGDMNQLD